MQDVCRVGWQSAGWNLEMVFKMYYWEWQWGCDFSNPGKESRTHSTRGWQCMHTHS